MSYRVTNSRRGADAVTQKAVSLAPGERVTLCDAIGAGRIARIWFTAPPWSQPGVLNGLVLQAYWDDEETPSIDVPLGIFFGASFSRLRSLISERLVVAGGAAVSRFEMPFNSRARVEIVNDSAAHIANLFFQVTWLTESPPPSPRATFHAQYRRHRSVPRESLVLLEAAGQGHFVGLCLDLQCDEWWLRPPLREIALPRGFGLGVLEGWESFAVDGEPAVSGTGGEDYFGGGFYFLGGAFSTPGHGCTRRSFLTGRVSAYRFHLDDPVPFRSALRLTLDHGFLNSMQCEAASVAYWYQAEPHAPFPPRPSPELRRFPAPLRQPFQWALAVAILVVMGMLVWWAIGR